jgi:nucleotide-binding universal stress UspA family protein
MMKILVASGGSHESFEPVTAAARFPWPVGSEIHVISVAEVVQPVMVGMVPEAIDMGDIMVITGDQAKKTAIEAAQRFRELGFAAEGIVAEGDPETTIIDHAKAWGADLIVVGSHQRSLVERMLVGSISNGVIKHAPCSVLVVREP